MTDTHAMLAEPTHDELAEQMFVRDLKVHMFRTVDPLAGKLAEVMDPGEHSNSRVETTYEALSKKPGFARFVGLYRGSQELLWSLVGHSVDRQARRLEEIASNAPQDLGSLTLDPEMEQPEYIAEGDIHMMPGGYALDDGSLVQGALMDRGGAVYMLGQNGGFLNDRRGWTLAAHLNSRWPDLKPEKILEMGCGIGASIVPLAKTYPDAEVHGIDVGASMLRYALARARHLGAAVHFRQASAEATSYPDESFDVIFSCAMFHETSPDAMSNIMDECFRLLRPGGIVAHLEVPQRYEDEALWTQVRGELERVYNNEPNWKTAISANYQTLLKVAGFEDVAIGYQDATGSADSTPDNFSDTNKGVFQSWFVASGVKPPKN